MRIDDSNEKGSGGLSVKESSLQLDSSSTEILTEETRERVSLALTSPEKLESFAAFARALIGYLPEIEKQQFIDDPLNFTSERLFFRGFSKATYEKVKKDEKFSTTLGQFGGEAVYVSNSPYAAFKHNSEVVAVLDKSKVEYASEFGLVAVGSNMYTRENARYLANLPKDEHKVAVYEMDNRWDLEERVATTNPNERIISLRKNQPIETAAVFIITENGNTRCELASHHP